MTIQDMMLDYGEKRALAEIESILDSQWENGMLPQIRFQSGQGGYSPDEEEWGVTAEISGCSTFETSGITQPPILGYSLYKIYENSENKSSVLSELEKFYKRTKKYHDFLLRERDPRREFLLSVIHPWETGTDNSPYMDEAVRRSQEFLKKNGFAQRIRKRKDLNNVRHEFRPREDDYDCYGRLIDLFVRFRFNQSEILKNSPFVIQDVLFNSIFAASVKSLSLLSDLFVTSLNLESKTSYYEAEKANNNRVFENIKNAISTKLYDPGSGLFYSYDLATESLLKHDTVHCFSPVFAQIPTAEQVRRIQESYLGNEEQFLTEATIPTVSLSAKEFESLRYWRGPAWPVTNWIIYEGLKHYDDKYANELRCTTIKLIEQNLDLPQSKAVGLAVSLMQFNSYEDKYTTPSKTQYVHGWFWDSCLAAVGWAKARKPSNDETLWSSLKEKIEGIGNAEDQTEAYDRLSEEYGCFLFSEYFVPVSKGKYRAGMPIGAPMMTWSASLYLDLLSYRCQETI